MDWTVVGTMDCSELYCGCMWIEHVSALSAIDAARKSLSSYAAGVETGEGDDAIVLAVFAGTRLNVLHDDTPVTLDQITALAAEQDDYDREEQSNG